MRALPLLLLCALCALCTSAATSPAQAQEADFNLSDRLADLRVEDGKVILPSEAGPVAMEPQAFIDAVAEKQSTRGARGAVYQVLDITSPLGMIWVALGFVGQLLFSGRMIVQWLVSEKHKRSVVPPIFWWMSLGGSSMLLTYFIWRIDVVGILGQGIPWGIYARNLWLIYHPQPAPIPATEPASS